MPLRIQNKEIARVEKLRKSVQREPQDPNKTFGVFSDPRWYNCGGLPIFLRERRWETDNPGKPLFQNRLPGGQDFNPGPKGSESPCQLNLIDILDVKRHWTVLEDQGIKKITMKKKFNVAAEGGDARRPKETLQTEVPLNYLPDNVLKNCEEATHSHHPSQCFPMGQNKQQRAITMSQAKSDVEVAQINSGNDRGTGDIRNCSNVNATPQRLVQRRSLTPAHIGGLETASTMLRAGNMMAERSFTSPGLPDAGFDQVGFANAPMGLPHITFATKPNKPQKGRRSGSSASKPTLIRRGSLSTTASPGWQERELHRSQSSMY